jgi:hypothetical protein
MGQKRVSRWPPRLFTVTEFWRLAWIGDKRAPKNSTRRGFIRGETFSAISGDPDISCFLLLDDSVNELLLSLGLGASRILTLAHLTIGLFAKGPIVERRFYAYGLRCWVDEARILG